MKVYIETYGCQMNEYDSEIVGTILNERSFMLVPSLEDAEVVLLNTCSVRDHAAQRIFARVHEIRHVQQHRPLVIGLLGCMATNLREALLQEKNLPLDFIAGPDSYRRLPQLIDRAMSGERYLYDLELSKYETYADVYPRRVAGVNAWLAVMRGCDNFCSFCVVPYSRGRERSRSPQSVAGEVQRLVAEGFRQVTLLGQNVNSYRHGDHTFADLLEQVAAVPGLVRVRFTSPHPKDFPLRLLEVMAAHPNICKHVHLPLQAGSDRILDLMRRTYGKQEYLDLVTAIRQRLPQVALTTDIIVGFPGETDAEFADTVDVMQRVGFDSAFIFKYSERPGTLAAKRYPDDVPDEAKTARIVHLNDLQKKTSSAINQRRIGEVVEVLVEKRGTKKSAEDCQGRTDGNTLVILPGGSYQPGEMVKAEICDATAHVLKGRVVS